MISFLIGLVIGAILGFMVLALVVINREDR